MLREEVDEMALEAATACTWAPEPPREHAQREPSPPQPSLDWRTVDRALQDIRHGRAALDAEEMYWLREADNLQIWRPLGLVSAGSSCASKQEPHSLSSAGSLRSRKQRSQQRSPRRMPM